MSEKKPFHPFVAPETPIEKISALINRENSAVLVQVGDRVHILTEYDIIQAIAEE